MFSTDIQQVYVYLMTPMNWNKRGHLSQVGYWWSHDTILWKQSWQQPYQLIKKPYHINGYAFYGIKRLKAEVSKCLMNAHLENDSQNNNDDAKI